MALPSLVTKMVKKVDFRRWEVWCVTDIPFHDEFPAVDGRYTRRMAEGVATLAQDEARDSSVPGMKHARWEIRHV